MCHVHSWPLSDLDLWPQYQNYIFTINKFLWILMGWTVIALWHSHTKFWHMGVLQFYYILDLCMTMIFDLWVGGGGILSEFYFQFYLVFYHVKQMASYECLANHYFTFIPSATADTCMEYCWYNTNNTRQSINQSFMFSSFIIITFEEKCWYFILIPILDIDFNYF